MSTYPPEDPAHEFNSPKYHTGKPCIERGCTNPAGTGWSRLWCQPCNAKRMRHITFALDTLASGNRLPECPEGEEWEILR